jgi:Flp pilus assembly protein TadG
VTPPRRVPDRTDDDGQASVELALLLPVVVLLLLAVLQVGLLARDVVLVTHASREAARAAATDPDPAAARLAASASGGLDPDRLTVTVEGRAGAGSRVRVEVTYRAETSVPLIGALVGDRTVRSTATMRVETPRARVTRSRSVGTNRPNWDISDDGAGDPKKPGTEGRIGPRPDERYVSGHAP